MIRKLLTDTRGSTTANYMLVGLMVGSAAMATAPMFGEAFDQNVQGVANADSVAQSVGGRSAGAEGSAAADITFGEAAAFELGDSTLATGGSYGETPDFEASGGGDGGDGGGFWKGLLIVGGAVAITAGIALTAPLSVPALLVVGGAALIGTATISACATGAGGCFEDAGAVLKSAGEALIDPIVNWRETLAVANTIVVQPVVQCASGGNCRQALSDSGGAVRDMAVGIKDMAVGCATGNELACAQSGVLVSTAGAGGAASNLVRGNLATKMANGGASSRMVGIVNPRGGITGQHGARGLDVPETNSVAVAPTPWLDAGCFAAGTQVTTAAGAVAIEDVELGDRIITADAELLETTTQVDATWRVYSLGMPLPSGSEMRIETIRPQGWAPDSGSTFVAIEELGLAGDATVLSTRPAPAIELGDGFVVMSTFTKIADDMLRITFEDSEQVLDATSNHPFYSLDQNDWVHAGELTPGENLRTQSGGLRVASITEQRSQRVFNIEVEHAHTYLVGEEAVLTHNQCAQGPGPVTLGRRGSLEAELAELQELVGRRAGQTVSHRLDGSIEVSVDRPMVATPGTGIADARVRLEQVQAALDADDAARVNHGLGQKIDPSVIDDARQEISHARAEIARLENDVLPEAFARVNAQKDQLFDLPEGRTMDDVFTESRRLEIELEDARQAVAANQRVIEAHTAQAQRAIQSNAMLMAPPKLSDTAVQRITRLSDEDMSALAGTGQLEKLRSAAAADMHAQQILRQTNEFADPDWGFAYQARQNAEALSAEYVQARRSATEAADRAIKKEAAVAERAARVANGEINYGAMADEAYNNPTRSASPHSATTVRSLLELREGRMKQPTGTQWTYHYDEIQTGHARNRMVDAIGRMADAEGTSVRTWLDDLNEKGTRVVIENSSGVDGHRAAASDTYHVFYSEADNAIHIRHANLELTRSAPKGATQIKGPLFTKADHYKAFADAVEKAQ